MEKQQKTTKIGKPLKIQEDNIFRKENKGLKIKKKKIELARILFSTFIPNAIVTASIMDTFFLPLLLERMTAKLCSSERLFSKTILNGTHLRLRLISNQKKEINTRTFFQVNMEQLLLKFSDITKEMYFSKLSLNSFPQQTSTACST